MNKPAMINAMKTSISEVLEQMFFLPIDMAEPENESMENVLGSHTIGSHTIGVMVGFEGSPSGTFFLKIPSDLAASITADFLGTAQEDLSLDEITGTVKEMINMLAGNSLSAYDANALFNLQIPELATENNEIGISKADKECIHMGIETMDNRMTLHMVTQQPDSA